MNASEDDVKQIDGRDASWRIARLWHATARSVSQLFGSQPVLWIELAAAAAGVTCVFALLDPAPAAFAAAWWWLVLAVVRSDLAEFQIPDQTSLAIALLGLVQIAVMVSSNTASMVAVPITLLIAFVSGLASGALLWIIGRTYRWISGRDGLGFGDVKLMAASGLWLSPMQQAVALELAALAALAIVLIAQRQGIRDRGGALPFGAFLAPAAWVIHVTDAALPGLFEGWS
jgi:prepilin signal peptidase PulO-like enzyme (type II secretory pathway)